MQRYYKRSREECFDADGWTHSGDLVRADADGFIYFVGRLSAMIKTARRQRLGGRGGEGSPRSPASPAHVVRRSGRRRGQLLAAVWSPGPMFRRRRPARRLKAELSAYKIETFVALHRAEVPLLSSGKVDTRQLRKLFDA